MIHRFALRVLPSLTLAVTEEQFRKRKRWVMLWPGLVAFALYRAISWFTPVHDAFSLLLLSGCIAAATALWAYSRGRQTSFLSLWVEDGARRIGWLVGWIGFAYGVQLSLLVLALLRVLANYDFLLHPDGPAMMALIIPSTSVARDAFEIVLPSPPRWNWNALPQSEGMVESRSRSWKKSGPAILVWLP